MIHAAIFGEIDAWRLFVISVSKPRNFDLCCEFVFLVQSEEILTCVCVCVCSWRSLRRLVRMRCLCTCSVFVDWSRARSCCSRVARVRCVCMFAVQSVESCACAVSSACGGLKSVEHSACPRRWSVGRGSVFVFACVFLVWFSLVGGVYGGCSWWRLQSVRRVSLCFFSIRHDREVATHSSCSAKSSHFVRLVQLARPVRLVWPVLLVSTRANADISVDG